MAFLFVEEHFKAVLIGEANFIVLLQNTIGENNSFLLKVSRYCEPAFMMSVFFPVFASLNTHVALQILLVSTCCEWGSVLFKWVLAEPRPYWWVMENKLNIPIRHNDLTCEPSPGSPSTHVMCCAALQYVFMFYVFKWIEDTLPQNMKIIKKLLKGFCWIFYIYLVIFISVTRINVGSHFPHQCIFGGILGYLLASFLLEDPEWGIQNGLFKLSKRSAIEIVFFLFIFTGFVFGSHYLFNVDPNWSTKLAIKWCKKPNGINFEMTSTYCLVRDAACFIGMALSSPIKERLWYPLIGAILTTLFMVSSRLLKPLMPNNDPFEYYFFHFLDNLMITYFMLTIIPFLSSWILSVNQPTKNKKNS